MRQVAVHATLGEEPELRDVGTALMYNMATREVKTVVCIAASLHATSAMPSPADDSPALYTVLYTLVNVPCSIFFSFNICTTNWSGELLENEVYVTEEETYTA